MNRGVGYQTQGEREGRRRKYGPLVKRERENKGDVINIRENGRDIRAVGSPTKQLSVNWEGRLGGCIGCYPSIDEERTCTASAVFPTPPSPRTATLQLSISCCGRE